MVRRSDRRQGRAGPAQSMRGQTTRGWLHSNRGCPCGRRHKGGRCEGVEVLVELNGGRGRDGIHAHPLKRAPPPPPTAGRVLASMHRPRRRAVGAPRQRLIPEATVSPHPSHHPPPIGLPPSQFARGAAGGHTGDGQRALLQLPLCMQQWRRRPHPQSPTDGGGSATRAVLNGARPGGAAPPHCHPHPSGLPPLHGVLPASRRPARVPTKQRLPVPPPVCSDRRSRVGPFKPKGRGSRRRPLAAVLLDASSRRDMVGLKPPAGSSGEAPRGGTVPGPAAEQRLMPRARRGANVRERWRRRRGLGGAVEVAPPAGRAHHWSVARQPTANDSAVHPWRDVGERRPHPHVQAADFPATADEAASLCANTARLQAVSVTWDGGLAASAGSLKENSRTAERRGGALLSDRSLTEWWRLESCAGSGWLAACIPALPAH